MKKILFIGDSGHDYYSEQNVTKLGGCSLNAATQAKRLVDAKELAVEVHLCSPLGMNGSGIETHTQKQNIKTHFFKRAGICPIQKIKILENGEKDFYGYDGGVIENFKLKEDLPQADIALMPCFKEAIAFNQEVINHYNGDLYFDFFDLADFSKDLSKIINLLDYAKGALFGLDKKQDKELIKQIKEYAKEKNKFIIITLAADGAIILEGEKETKVKPPKVESIIDTTGAGDAFIGTFLTARLAGLPLKDCSKLATQASAEVISQIGCF